MKDYIKKQWTGNENGWNEPVKEISTHRMYESQAEELNSHFRNTGIKYEEIVAEKPKAAPKEESKPVEEKKSAPKSKKAVAPKVEKAAEHKAE